MRKIIDLTNKKFGKLIVVKRGDNTKYGKLTWQCKCDCGKIKFIMGGDLKSGKTISCGCIKKEMIIKRNISHGMYKTKQYSTYRNMLARCYYQNNNNYKYYGLRGITVCDRWLDSFENFWEDMGYTYYDNLSLERLDVNGNYCKENCKWITTKDQCRNKRNNHLITYDGKTCCLAEWAEILGMKFSTIEGRINRYGWSTERAFTTK